MHLDKISYICGFNNSNSILFSTSTEYHIYIFFILHTFIIQYNNIGLSPNQLSSKDAAMPKSFALYLMVGEAFMVLLKELLFPYLRIAFWLHLCWKIGDDWAIRLATEELRNQTM